MDLPPDTPRRPALPLSGSLFAELPPIGQEESFLPLLQSDTTCIERIVSRGHANPPGFWYDQPDDEWVMLASGAAELLFEDGRRLIMRPGDWVTIPARCRHRVESTGPETVWLAVHIRRLPGKVSCA